MVATKKEFLLDMTTWVDSLEDDAEKIIVKFCKRLRYRLAVLTPVDTGRAASSWNLSVGDINPYSYPEGYYNHLDYPNLGKVTVGGFKIGKPLYISNNIVYITSLNKGFSRHQPQPFYIEREVFLNARTYLREVVRG
jgi:hypothetical protein